MQQSHVLELSLLEAGVIPDQSVRFDLQDLVQGLVDSQHATAKTCENALRLTCNLDDVPFIYGDPNRVQQALLNLIGSALKFTSNGSDEVEMSSFGDKDEVNSGLSTLALALSLMTLSVTF